MKTIENITIDNKEKAIIESGHDVLNIKNVSINMIDLPESSPGTSSFGADIRSCQLVDIDTLKIKATSITRKYAYGLRLGYANTPASVNKLVRIKNSSINGFGPSNGGNYNLNNRDGIALEGGELWLKDTIISDVSDACVDSKGSFKALRCTFEKGYRTVRIWPGQTVILSNCKVDSVWFQDNTGTLILFNTPMPTIDNNSTPGVVQVVNADPLTDPWFTGVKKLNLTKEQLEYLASL